MDDTRIILTLLAVLGWTAGRMIKSWLDTWKTRRIAVDTRLSNAERRQGLIETRQAVLENELRHFTEKQNEISTGVKELLTRGDKRDTG